VPAVSDPRVLVDATTRDDAAVFRLADDRALVATVDFFTPIVDDAHQFGAIAAANALSDLYAMGARPLFALNLVGWPRRPELLALLEDVVRGAAEVLQEAGAFMLGGHSIDDPEPKFGMVTIGEVHPDRIVTNAGAKPGDRLVLTKPIGTGILSTALKGEMIGEESMGDAIRSMTALNRGAMEAMEEVRDAVRAATDVTGFGLLGHLHNLLRASKVGARLDAHAVPVFDHVRELAERGAVPGGTERNLAAAEAYTTWEDGVSPVERTILADAQTSGGLLIAVAPERLAALRAALVRREAQGAVVGEVTAAAPGTIAVGTGGAPA